jgi:Sec-independent protein translocase protein TatA
LLVEGREQRPEKAGNQREDDRGCDDLESCLREYKETMNNATPDTRDITGAYEEEGSKTNPSKEQQSTNEETQLSHGSDNDLSQ